MNSLENDVTLDDIAVGLQHMRLEAGNPSYQEIALRVSAHRKACGLSTHAATTARHTIYDCFQLGRKRVNSDLVRDIVRVLTGDDQVAERWRKRCLEAQRPKHLAETPISPHLVSVLEPQTVTFNDSQVKVAEDNKPSASSIILVLLIGVMANIIPIVLVQTIFSGGNPLFFDTIGTAIVAIVLGPWWGVATALISELARIPQLIPLTGFGEWRPAFTIVAIVAALIWGYGIRKWGLSQSISRFLTLNLIVGVACAISASIIILVLFGDQTMHVSVQQFSELAVASGLPLGAAIFLSNLIISIIDKLLAGLIALLVAGRFYRRHAPRALIALTQTVTSGRR